MNTVFRLILIVIAGLAALVGIGWLGLQVKAAPFPSYPATSGPVETVPMPDDLPAPVDRFYRTQYGDEIPLIESFVVTGHGPLRPFAGITFQSNFRFTHIAGQDYRHYIEATWFGLPIMKVNERYVDGVSRMETPAGTEENEPQTNDSANLGLWAETFASAPWVLVTDPRVRWEPIDETHARLVVPFEDNEQSFIAAFDPESGLLISLDTLRWHAADSPEKVGWLTETLEWADFGLGPVSAAGAATWADEGTPWAIFHTDQLIYNVDVSEYVRQKGL
jgi:hypothetical protein